MSFGGMPLSTLQGMVNGKRGIDIVTIKCSNCNHQFQANKVVGKKKRDVGNRSRRCPGCGEFSANVIDE